jgi:predicted DCC family thiol-disulfide oxidoreductase YuxK
MGTLFSMSETRPIIAAKQTTPPDRNVVLYDGLCKFCQAGMKCLLTLAKLGAIEPVNFQAPGALARFPGISHEACMKQMHLVTPQGKVYGGFEAAVRALATRPIVGKLAYAYYLPGLKQLFDFLYAAIAAHRYRILGKAVSDGECAEGTCALHSRPHDSNNRL